MILPLQSQLARLWGVVTHQIQATKDLQIEAERRSDLQILVKPGAEPWANG